MSKIQAKQVVKYVVLPGIIPRIGNLFASGFGRIAFLMARIYAMVHLLPASHPYLNEKNVGEYGLRHVIAAAANNLVLDRRNIDQILIFGVLLLAIVVLAVQIILLVVVAFSGASVAVAAGMTGTYTAGASIFETARPADDIAFILMDRVFGLPGFFNSCVSTGLVCAGTDVVSGAFPWPFHIALHELFRFYSTAMLIIGVLIFAYFVVVIVAETATTGTPFGQRFQNVWVPVRLVLAIGLLIPVNYGYNSAQYIVFAAAKYGSSLATNAWIRYNNTIYGHADFAGVDTSSGNPLGEDKTMVSVPKQPDFASVIQSMSLIHTCAFTEFLHDEKLKKKVRGVDTLAGPTNVFYPDQTSDIADYMSKNNVKPYFLKTPASWMGASPSFLEVTATTTYQDALDFFFRGDIFITFGRKKDTTKVVSSSNFVPVCGEMQISVTDPRDAAGGAGPYPDTQSPYLGAVAIQQEYFNFIRNAWFNVSESETYIDFAGRFVLKQGNTDPTITPCMMGCTGAATIGITDDCIGVTPPTIPPTMVCEAAAIGANWKQELINEVTDDLKARLIVIWNKYNDDVAKNIAMEETILDRGWGGAGIWFNRLASVNGMWTVAHMKPPTATAFPLVMEKVQKVRVEAQSNIGFVESFNPTVSDAKVKAAMKVVSESDQKKAIYYHKALDYWFADQADQSKQDKIVTSPLETAMNTIFGTHGMIAMRSDNAQTHPLSQLTTLGRGLVEASIRNIAISTGGSAFGGVAANINKHLGMLSGAAASFANNVSFIGLTAGLVLYYIVPFLPFVYFFFAIASWIKTIFEAMVGVPLWALAHLRIDGDGLSGESAQNGYFLIFEIFLRPILSVFGLIAALAIFTAQVRILHFTWDIVIKNTGGFSDGSTISVLDSNHFAFERSVVDQFFFTITYAIIVYMMATASFKLVDTIPDNILRWLGSGVSSFGDINQDQTGEITRYAAMGGMTAGREVAGGIQEVGKGLGNIGGAMGRWGVRNGQ